MHPSRARDSWCVYLVSCIFYTRRALAELSKAVSSARRQPRLPPVHKKGEHRKRVGRRKEDVAPKRPHPSPAQKLTLPTPPPQKPQGQRAPAGPAWGKPAENQAGGSQRHGCKRSAGPRKGKVTVGCPWHQLATATLRPSAPWGRQPSYFGSLSSQGQYTHKTE